MRKDILSQISSMKEVSHVVVLTHNIDFVFTQTVFLSALKKCGNPGLTIFADAHCAGESFQYQYPLLTNLGKKFRVIPVAMNHGYRFHPKAIFLTSTDTATLYVGSGNLTFGGLKENAEIWSTYSTSDEITGPFSNFRDYLFELTERVLLSDSVERDLIEIYDEHNNSWATKLDSRSGLIGKLGSSKSLMDQISETMSDNTVNKITVCAPFYDPDGHALKHLSDFYKNLPITVLIQSHRSNLFLQTAKSLPSNIKIQSIAFKHSEKTNRERFIHAKFFAFEHENTVSVFAGSGNCSISALLKNGADGNAELMSFQTLSKPDFQEKFLDEFEYIDEPPVLINKDDFDDESITTSKLWLLGARHDINTLRIGYKANKGAFIDKCFADDISIEFEVEGENELSAKLHDTPKRVKIEALIDDLRVESNVIWVDDESKLQASVHGRTLLEQITSTKKKNYFGAEDWMLFVELFAKDLNYTTVRELQRKSMHCENEKGGGSTTILSQNDVFPAGYDQIPIIKDDEFSNLSGNKFDIYNLLLSAFGGHFQDSNQIQEGKLMENEGETEDTVDMPEKLPTKQDALPTTRHVLNKYQKDRVTKLAEKIATSITASEFLEIRDPYRLGIDLQLAGLLIRKGYSQNWLSAEQFFDITQRIWSVLFYSIKKKEETGWLEKRLSQSDHKDKFIRSMSSPALAAVLFAWAMAAPLKKSDLLTQRFVLSQILGMRKNPWLWSPLAEKESAIHLLKVLQDSPCGNTSDISIKELHGKIHKLRLLWTQYATAFASMEAAIEEKGFSNLMCDIKNHPVETGDLLWQGRRGICLAIDSSQNSQGKIRVVCLQDPDGETEFKTDRLVPMKYLIKDKLLLDSSIFTDKQRVQMHSFIKYLRNIDVNL